MKVNFSTITPASYERFACQDVRSIEVWTEDDRFATINYPRGVFVGRNSITVQGQTKAETVRLFGQSGVVSLRTSSGKVVPFGA